MTDVERALKKLLDYGIIPMNEDIAARASHYRVKEEG